MVMVSNSKSSTSVTHLFSAERQRWCECATVFVVFSWCVVFFSFWSRGKIQELIHVYWRVPITSYHLIDPDPFLRFVMDGEEKTGEPHHLECVEYPNCIYVILVHYVYYNMLFFYDLIYLRSISTGLARSLNHQQYDSWQSNPTICWTLAGWRYCDCRSKKNCVNLTGNALAHSTHVWYIDLHLVDFYGKCR